MNPCFANKRGDIGSSLAFLVLFEKIYIEFPMLAI